MGHYSDAELLSHYTEDVETTGNDLRFLHYHGVRLTELAQSLYRAEQPSYVPPPAPIIVTPAPIIVTPPPVPPVVNHPVPVPSITHVPVPPLHSRGSGAVPEPSSILMALPMVLVVLVRMMKRS